MNHALREEDALEILLGALLGICTRGNHQLLRLGGIPGKKTRKSLNREIQSLAIRVAVAVQKHHCILGNIELSAKCRTIGKRLKDISIRRMLKDTHLCLRTPRELRLVDIRPLGRKRVDRFACLINSIEKRLGNPKVDLVDLCPNLVVCLLAILLDCLQKLLNDEGIVLEKHELRVDCLDVLRKLVEPKALLTRILSSCRVLRNHPLGNLAMVGVPRMALKSEVKDLELRGQRRHLAKEIVGNLGIPSRLVHMSAHKKNPH